MSAGAFGGQRYWVSLELELQAISYDPSNVGTENQTWFSVRALPTYHVSSLVVSSCSASTGDLGRRITSLRSAGVHRKVGEEFVVIGKNTIGL